MKTLILIVFSISLSANLFAQSPKAIEADLLNSFKRISYLEEHKRNMINIDDSLYKANTVFGKKLKDYTEKYSFTIKMPFSSLKKNQLNICTSSDGLFKIYSWATGVCCAPDFQNILQFKTGENTGSILVADTVTTDEDGNSGNYVNMYILKVGAKSYYLAVYDAAFTRTALKQGVRIFSIDDNVLNANLKIIKTSTGLHNKIEFNYDFMRVADIKTMHKIHFDQQANKLYIPIAFENGEVSNRYITYKFTGQYFEKIKS